MEIGLGEPGAVRGGGDQLQGLVERAPQLLVVAVHALAELDEEVAFDAGAMWLRNTASTASGWSPARCGDG